MFIYLTMTAAVIAVSFLMKRSSAVSCQKHDWRYYDGNYGNRVYRSPKCVIDRQTMLNRVSMVIIFTMLFVVSAIRINVGNDYAKYVEFMHLIYSDAYVPTEAGFNLLTNAVYHFFGYENFMMVFAIISFATIALFLAAMWQQSTDFVWTFAMFMLLGYYFQSISTVRYYLALAIALYSIKYVIRQDWPKFIILVIAGALFHKSMLVILIVYPLARIKWKRWMLLLAGCCCVAVTLMREQVLELVVRLYPTYEGTEYLSGGTSYISIARCAAVLILSLICYDHTIRNSRRNQFYFYCNLMALALYVFGSFIPVVSRIGYYLTVQQILFVPELLGSIKESRLKKCLKILTIAACIMYFAMYMSKAGSDGIRILPYQTFMFNDMPPILSEKGY